MDLDMSILHEETLRAGSSNKEYKEFTSWVETQANKVDNTEIEVDTIIPS